MYPDSDIKVAGSFDAKYFTKFQLWAGPIRVLCPEMSAAWLENMAGEFLEGNIKPSNSDQDLRKHSNLVKRDFVHRMIMIKS